MGAASLQLQVRNNTKIREANELAVPDVRREAEVVALAAVDLERGRLAVADASR